MRGRMAGMMLHKLRIVSSVLSSVVAVLLIALWLRSYWSYEVVEVRSFPHSIMLGATRGVAYVNYGRISPDSPGPANEGWHYNPQTPIDLNEPLVFSYGDHLLIITPIWLPLIIAVIPTVAPAAVYAARKINPDRRTNRRSTHAKSSGQ